MPSEMPSFPFRSQCTNNHIKTNKTNHTGIIVNLFNHTLLSPVVQFAIQQKKIVTLCFCAFQATCTNNELIIAPVRTGAGGNTLLGESKQCATSTSSLCPCLVLCKQSLRGRGLLASAHTQM